MVKAADRQVDRQYHQGVSDRDLHSMGDHGFDAYLPKYRNADLPEPRPGDRVQYAGRSATHNLTLCRSERIDPDARQQGNRLQGHLYKLDVDPEEDPDGEIIVDEELEEWLAYPFTSF